MANIAFGELLQLMLSELSQTIDQSAAQAEIARVRIDDIELDIPAHLQLLTNGTAEDEVAFARDGMPSTAKLLVGMPSPRETLPAGRVGRIRVTFEAIKSERPTLEELS